MGLPAKSAFPLDPEFAVVADPHKQLYAEFGMQASMRSLIDPRALLPIFRAVMASLWRVVTAGKKMPPVIPEGGRFGLPADFLLASDGNVIASKYGAHAYDQWSVDEVLVLARSTQAAGAKKGVVVKTRRELNRELRERILGLPGVTERQNAGIHEDAFFLGRTMFMHIHGHGHCDIRLSKADQERVLAEGKASPHRWSPKAGFVTFMVNHDKDLKPALELIRMSHRHFTGNQLGE